MKAKKILARRQQKSGDIEKGKNILISQTSPILIVDNELTDELRCKCHELIRKCKTLPLDKRRLRYEELHLLLDELLDNKNRNYRDILKRLSLPTFFEEVPVYCIFDRETESLIAKIFNILTDNLDNIETQI